MNLNPLAIPTLVIASVLFLLGHRLHKRLQTRMQHSAFLFLSILSALPACAYVAYYSHFFDNIAWFYSLRAIRYTELLGAGAGLLAGYFAGWLELDSRRKVLLLLAGMELFVFIPFIKPILVPLDTSKLHDRCEAGVCLQSTPSTCGPASAATLLLHYRVEASERELATECFTYRVGTENWYLMRALRRRGLKARAVVVDPSRSPMPSPSIAGVVLPGGAGHFVAVLECTSDECTVVDPIIGELHHRNTELRTRYRLTGFFLQVPPPPASEHLQDRDSH